MNIDPHSKDAVHTMAGKWVIELSEMTALRWSDAAALKSFLSRATDTVRLSYERHAKDFPRQSIFIGTVNPEHIGYLNDTTGNRRYWIVHTPGPIDIIALENDCNQLWAEAMRAYRTELLYLTGDAERMQVTEALNRMPEDPMKHHVLKYIQENPDVDQVTMADLCGYVGIPSKNADKGTQQRLATAICEAGWEKKRVPGVGGVLETSYCRPIAQIVARQAREL